AHWIDSNPAPFGYCPVHAKRSRIGVDPVCQEVLSGQSVCIITRKKVGLAKDGQKLQTRKLIWHLDVRAVVPNAIAKFQPLTGPRQPRDKVQVPLRPYSKLGRAVAKEGIPSRPNF